MESVHASMREARARFAELLDDAERGNVTLITRHGRAAAAIVPVTLLGQLAAPSEARPGPEAGPALQAVVASLRDALGALEPLLGREPAPTAAAAHAGLDHPMPQHTRTVQETGRRSGADGSIVTGTPNPARPAHALSGTPPCSPWPTTPQPASKNSATSTLPTSAAPDR